MVARKVCKNAGEDPAHRKRPARHAGPRCASCARSATKDTRTRRHGTYVEKVYGITSAEYDAIKALQGGRCAGCARATGARKALAVDHDHALEVQGLSLRSTVRGLLCGTCNKTLGHFRDDPAALRRMADYLENPPAHKILRTNAYTIA